MEIVDIQLHEPGPLLPWVESDAVVRRAVWREIVEQMMEAVGVDAVVLHPVEDVQFAEELTSSDPQRFAIVPMLVARFADKPVAIAADAGAPDIAEAILRAYQTPGVVAIRVAPHPLMNAVEYEKLQSGGYDRAFAACEQYGVPVMLMLSGFADEVALIAARFPDLQIIFDHMGLLQPPNFSRDRDLSPALASVLGLARFPNVALKLCGAPSLSDERYPFSDVWPLVSRLLEAFGVSRVAWGSDIGRFRGRVGSSIRWERAQAEYAGKHNYMESLAFYLFRDELATHEKEMLLGRTARALLKWPTA